MRSARSDSLPALASIAALSRPMSTPEYYHASIGTHARTLEPARKIVAVLEGDHAISIDRWQAALDAVSAVNPGLRLRLHGQRRATRWISDAPAPRVVQLPARQWNTRSSFGAEFLIERPLSLREGCNVELLLLPRAGESTLVVLHTHHAIMDGAGAMHMLQELFRALRAEPLLGSNCTYSDVDLMREQRVPRSESRHIKTTWLTGEPSGLERGDDWRRIALGKPRRNQLARVAAALAEFMHRHSDLPALIAVPVNLRRHQPGIVSTGNYSAMLHVALQRGEGADAFREKLSGLLASRSDAFYPGALDLVRWLPMPWLDRLLSRTPENFHRKRAVETAVISNLGRIDPLHYSAPGFTLRDFFVLPLAGSAFSILTCVDDRVDLALNLPRVLASNGRFDAIEAHLRERFPA
ncbi:hypothetical protein [Hydrocarboniphaga effusa]|uniref:hypothetical protein n=1 Tax=Hydrocarboniphaga effusa TaxID=243629 RepID=UPI00398BC4BB